MEHAIIFKFCSNMNWNLTMMEKDLWKCWVDMATRLWSQHLKTETGSSLYHDVCSDKTLSQRVRWTLIMEDNWCQSQVHTQVHMGTCIHKRTVPTHTKTHIHTNHTYTYKLIKRKSCQPNK